MAVVAGELAAHLDGYRVIVTKSTVPVGTGAWLRTSRGRAPAGGRSSSTSSSNPEFLREGSAVSDFLRPDRVVIGTQQRAGRRDHARDLPPAVPDRNADRR